MAKTGSQIAAEQKIKKAEAAAIAASRDAIHQKQMAGIAEESAAKTLAVLNKAISSTSDSAKKSELSRAAQMVTDSYKKSSSATQEKSGQKTAIDMQKKKEDRIEEKSQVDSLQIKKDRAEKALKDFDDNKEIDWTDTNQRKQYDAERKRLQDEVDRASAEFDAREDATTHEANMAEIAAMSDEDRGHLEEYIESRDSRRAVFGNPISWFQNYSKESENKNVLLDKYGEDRLAELAETYGRQLHEEQAKKVAEDTKSSVDQNWISAALHNVAAIPARAMGGIVALSGRMYEKVDRTGQYRTLEEYTPGDMLSLYGNTVSSSTAQNIAGDDANAGRQFLSIGYQGVMSLVDSIARAFFGGGAAGGASLAATGSFTQTVSEATQQGASPQQAVALGVATAGMEYISEKIPMDEVFKLAKGGKTNVLMQAFKQAGIEITTEELSLFGSMAAEAAILQEKSSYKQQIGDLVANGASYEDAKKQADKTVWEEVKQTAYVSGFAGGFSGGGAAIIGNLNASQTMPEEIVQGTAEETPVVEPAQPEPTSFLEDTAQQLMQEAPAAESEALTPEQQMIDLAAAETMGVQPEAQPAIDTTQQTEYDNNMIIVPGATVGKSGVTYTADNKPVQFQYAVVPAESLVTSNDQYGNVNKAYPAELQPRDRTRAASQTQINSMSRNLNPALLAESPTAQNGAPIIRGDGVVIGGNGRVSAITQAYGSGRGAEYQQYITERAAELGIDPATLPANPVLVRVTTGVDNYTELANSLNASTTATYSATEAAKADAGRVGDIIEYLSVSEDGSVNTADNKDFIQKFVSQVVPDTERGDVMQANGQLSQAGERRIQNALFAYAYGDTALIERLTERTDSNIKNITGAMLKVSGKVATLQNAIDSGEIQDLGVRAAITDAVNLYLDAKNSQQTVTDAASQLMMGENGVESQYDGLTVHIAKALETYSRSGKQMQMLLTHLIDNNMLAAAEDAGQTGLFDTGGNITQEELYDQTVRSFAEAGGRADQLQPKSDFSQYREYQPEAVLEGMGGTGTEGASSPPEADGRNNGSVSQRLPGRQPVTAQPTPQVNNAGIKGIGAAESNFSQKPAYNATLSEDNAQADRRGDVRPMELPQRDINGGNVSAVTGNVYGSRITPDDFASLMEEPTAKGDFTYAKITNDQATELAVDTISQCGDWNTAYSQWVREVDRGVAGAEMTARGALLLNHAAQEGNKAKWLDILSDMQRLGTNTAQGLQAFRIIRTLSAPDKIEFAKVTVQKMVQDLNLGVEIEIDETLLNEYEQAQTDEERDAILLDIQQNVADQIPATAIDKWTALRYMNMLGNLKTNVRNVMGNVGSSLVYRMKDQIATTMERIAGTERTKSHAVSRELLDVCKQDFEQFKDVVSSGGKYSDGLSSNEQFRQGVMDKRRIFNNPLLEGYRKGTNWMMNNGIFGDEAFGRAAYARALAGFLKANGVTAEQFQQMVAEKPKTTVGTPKAIIPEGTKVRAADRQNYGTIQTYNKADNTYLVRFVSPSGHTANVNLSADILTPVGKKTDTLGPIPKPEQKMEFVDYARAYAIREAQEATFHDNSALAEIVSNVQKATGVIGQGIMPFTKTPANVLTRAVEFSPLGIINSTVKTIQSKRDVDISGADIVNSWAKTMTGTALFALGAIMMDQGLISGGPDEDKEKAEFDELNGQQNYAIQLPNGTNYTIDWLTPAAMPMFMGAQFWDIISNGENFTFADMEKVFTSIADPMIQMSMLQGLNDSLDNIKYSDNNLGQFFINAAVSYLTQGLTNTLMGQLERSTEEKRQTTYINKDSNIPQWMQQTLGKASQKIPGWDFQQTDYRNAWGQTEENEGDLWYNLLSPGYLSTEKNDTVSQELGRLIDVGYSVAPNTSARTVSYVDKDGYGHDDVQLTEEQFQKLAETQGQTARKLVEDMISSASYAAMTDEQKADAIDTAYLYARKTGEIAAIEDHTGYDQSWFYDVEKGGAEEILRRVLNSGLNTSMSDLDNAWDRGYNEENFSRELETAYESYRNAPADMRKQVYAEAEGTAKKYIEARDKGVSHEDFVTAAENIAKVKGTGSINKETGKATVRDIDRRQAIANTTGMTEKEIDIVMKAYMADYDPSDESPETTEMKYDYIRHEMDMSAKEYAATYRAYLDSSKKAQRIAAIRALGYDYGTALKLYKVYSGSMKKKLIDMYG